MTNENHLSPTPFNLRPLLIWSELRQHSRLEYDFFVEYTKSIDVGDRTINTDVTLFKRDWNNFDPYARKSCGEIFGNGALGLSFANGIGGYASKVIGGGVGFLMELIGQADYARSAENYFNVLPQA